MADGASAGVATAGGGFGARLRWWWRRRGLSQLELAAAAGTPQRHVSFLDTSPRLFTTIIATLGTPHDVTLQEIRIECFFPCYQALAGGRLAEAALDVWYRYPMDAAPTPPSRQPFHELPNVLMTPHVSGWTEGMLEARAARGEPPLNEIPPAA